MKAVNCSTHFKRVQTTPARRRPDRALGLVLVLRGGLLLQLQRALQAPDLHRSRCGESREGPVGPREGTRNSLNRPETHDELPRTHTASSVECQPMNNAYHDKSKDARRCLRDQLGAAHAIQAVHPRDALRARVPGRARAQGGHRRLEHPRVGARADGPDGRDGTFPPPETVLDNYEKGETAFSL